VDEFHRLRDAGVLQNAERVELLDGWILPKMTRNPPHDVALDKTVEAVRRRLPEEWRVRVQSAITTEDSEPEPDLVVVPGPAERFMNAHPGQRDVALVVEISNTSLSLDRNEKARLYARAGIPVYWIVNLVDRIVEVLSQPDRKQATYQQSTQFAPTDFIPLAIPGLKNTTIPASELIPKVS
jgi:Uma2 family endonuclease